MADFEIAFNRTFGHEKGYVNHPDDPGGRTLNGITERSHPELWKDGPPTYEQQLECYRGYWSEVRGDKVCSQAVANELFDTAVNAGSRKAVEIAQRAYNQLRPETWAGLIVDGRIGHKTLDAIERICQKYEAAYYNCMNTLQGVHYLNVGNKSFIRGWFANRITSWKGHNDE